MGRSVYASVGVAISAALGLLVAACGSTVSPLEQQVRTLRDELTRLQNSHDRLEERLALAENAAAREPGGAPKPEGTASAPVAVPELFRPQLEVVKLQPPAQPAGAEARSAEAKASGDSEPPRPLISGQGERIRADFVEDRAVKAPARRRSGR